MLKIGVTGTDTSVGKTVISCALITLLRSRRLRVGVMKPIETGVTRGDAGSDHVMLAGAAGLNDGSTDVCPFVFEAPLAPMMASRSVNEEISLSVLDDCFGRVCDGKDCVVVEGAGGLLAPIIRTLRFDGLFARWELELIIVASSRLGALNHTLLTVESAQRAGLRVRGIVLNQVHKVSSTPSIAENTAALRELLPEIPVVAFPWVALRHAVGGRSGGQLYEYGSPMDLRALQATATTTGLGGLVPVVT